MYKLEEVNKLPFFKFNDSEVFDSLSGVINRKYIIEYINVLIENKYPFSLLFLDIDNFKLINDSFGHHSGDIVLHDVGKNLCEYFGTKGLVGRFGGDEFLVVCFGEYQYDDIRNLINTLYLSKKVIRKNYKVDGFESFITGTIGSVSYPKDGLKYDELFIKIDKALYRGKIKGRNCFIIYLDEKHKDIDINSNVLPPLQQQFFELNQLLCSYSLPMRERQVLALKYISNTISMHLAMIVFNDQSAIRSDKTVEHETSFPTESLKKLKYNNNLFACNDANSLKKEFKDIYKLAEDNDLISFLISPICYQSNIYGYIIFAENKTRRIWQSDDMALITFFSLTLGIVMSLK